MKTLSITHLSVCIKEKEILQNINLDVHTGEVHAIMGPNGSGKSTLAHALMGHPSYQITDGTIMIDDLDVTVLSAEKRSKAGLFLSFQHPMAVSGLSLVHYLRTIYNAHHKKNLRPKEFRSILEQHMELLSIDSSFLRRSLNDGFSGGEKKKIEMLQMFLVEPSFAILDETDSGLDVDALKSVTTAINEIKGMNIGIVIITHYNRILEYVEPDMIHILSNGKLVKTGDKSLAIVIEQLGYERVINE